MQLFFHDVGKVGSSTDFPKTIFKKIKIEDILSHTPEELYADVKFKLEKSFPDGKCNVWGVPAGASRIIKQLEINDAMLLIATTGGDGSIPALCQIRAFWKHEMLKLSEYLWGSTHFPYVFFFDTQEIDLTWTQFKIDVGYSLKFRPSGNVYRVNEERLNIYGGADGYLNKILNTDIYDIPATTEYTVNEFNIKEEYAEGQRKLSEVSYFERNPKLALDAKKHYGYKCQVCGFDFEKIYGDLGKEYIECHHKNPLSETFDKFNSTIQDVVMLCANCHRMIHRKKPALTIEELISKLQNITKT